MIDGTLIVFKWTPQEKFLCFPPHYLRMFANLRCVPLGGHGDGPSGHQDPVGCHARPHWPGAEGLQGEFHRPPAVRNDKKILRPHKIFF